MAKIKTKEDVKGLPPLKNKHPGPYDEIVNKIRTELGIPMNGSLLARIATDDYISKRTSASGIVDIKAVAYPYARVKAQKEAEALAEKLEEKKAQLQAMK